jgi:hypothetical protein
MRLIFGITFDQKYVIIHAHIYIVRIRDLYDDGDEAIINSESRSIKNRCIASVGDVQQTEIDVSDTHIADNVYGCISRVPIKRSYTANATTTLRNKAKFELAL